MDKSKGNNYNITHSRLAITQWSPRTKIYQASQFKDLGITLNFSSHADMIKNKAMRNFDFIKVHLWLIYGSYSLKNCKLIPYLFGMYNKLF